MIEDPDFIEALEDFNKPIAAQFSEKDLEDQIPKEFIPEDFLKKYIFDKDPALDKIAPSNVERWSRGFGEGTKRHTSVFLVIPGIPNNELDSLKTKLIDPAEPFLLVSEQVIPRKKAGDVMVLIDYLDITISKNKEKEDEKNKENSSEPTTDREE